MAKIKPFKGIRPPKDFVEQVASRPYDVLNSEEARQEADGNEKSLYRFLINFWAMFVRTGNEIDLRFNNIVERFFSAISFLARFF